MISQKHCLVDEKVCSLLFREVFMRRVNIRAIFGAVSLPSKSVRDPHGDLGPWGFLTLEENKPFESSKGAVSTLTEH